jgi:hypothetical protein
VLKVIFRLENQTAVYRQASPNLLSYFQVDGAYDNAVLVTDGMERKRTKSMYWEWHPSCWTAVVNPDTGRAITVITASGRRETFLHDLGPEGGHVWLSEEAQIPPHSHHEMITYLVLADSLAQGKQYAVLSGSS